MNKDLKELFIKIKNVFSKDLYVIKGKYCVEGNISAVKNYGECIITLENKWLNIMNEFIKEMNLSDECFAILDIDGAKKWASGEEISSKDLFKNVDNYNNISNSLYQGLNEIDKIKDWDMFINDPKFIEDIFEDKGVYNIIIGDGNVIRIGKPALPLVTPKTVEKLYYNLTFDNERNLYKLLMKYNFTHFQLFFIYWAIPMKE